MDDQSGRLVDHQQVLVLVADVDRRSVVPDRVDGPHQRAEVDGQILPRPQRQALLGRMPVDGHRTRRDRPLGAGTRTTDLGEHDVESLPVLVLADDQPLDGHPRWGRWSAARAAAVVRR